VLNETVSNAFHTFGSPEAQNLLRRMFNKWFDVMNVCKFNDGKMEKKNILNIQSDILNPLQSDQVSVSR